jgi:hypothetical protein
MSMVATQFYVYSDDIDSSNEISEQIIERFKMDYPEATYATDYHEGEWLFTITFETNHDDIEDIDIFLCEEICNEYGYYCSISNEISIKAYYFDEEDEWVYKD